MTDSIVVNEIDTPSVVIAEDFSSILVSETVESSVIVVVERGLPGLPFSNTLLLLADTDLGVNRPVTSTQTGCKYVETVSESVVGITVASVVAGEMAAVRIAGELTGFSGLTPSGSLYLGANSTITQTPPTIGVMQILGVALTDSKINIQIQPPIFLG